MTDRQWWKGSFPAWLVAGLIAMNCFFVKRYLDQADEDRRMLFDHERRITKIEASPRVLGMVTSTNIGNIQ